MTHLQQALEARRAAQRGQEDFDATAGEPASILTVQSASGEAWAFLWSTLASAWYDQTEKRELIVLTFLRHTVRFEGQNLDRIFSLIGDLRLQVVREQVGGGDYAGRSETGKTVVTRMQVQEGAAEVQPEPTGWIEGG